MTNHSSPMPPRPETVPATLKLLSLLAEHFDVLEDFHPAYEDSITLVDSETRSGVTLVIVESVEL